MLPDSINPQLPAPGAGNPAEAAHSTALATYQSIYPEATPRDEERSLPLSHYLWVLRRHRWKIAAFVLASMIAAMVVTKRMTPIYESTATIDVDQDHPQEAVGTATNTSAAPPDETFLTTQVTLIQSDTVLRPVTERYNLLRVEHQIGPDRQASLRKENAPIRLRRLNIARPPATLLILISYRAADPQLAADVANAVARSYIEATYNIRFQSTVGLSVFMKKQIEELEAKMEKSSAALARFERDLNVINPEEKTTILSARLLQLNTEYTNAQADRVRKESIWNSLKNGSSQAADVAGENDALKIIKDHLNDARQKFTEAASHYGVNHPEYKKAAGQVAELTRELQEATQTAQRAVEGDYQQAVSREQMLQKTVADTKNEFDSLNARSFQYEELKREADADKKLYDEMIQKINEAGINAGFQGNAIRLADMARPAAMPVSPRPLINLLIAAVLSLIFGVAAAIASELLDNTVRDPEQVQRLLNTQVIGILPRAKTRAPLRDKSVHNGNGNGLMKLEDASNKQFTGYIESIRTLRNSILLNDLDRTVNSLFVTSAAPKEGKTTTAVHLALCNAEQRHKTLLVDCDLRRPTIHKYFGLASEGPGITEVALNGLPWRSAIQKIDGVPDLHVMVGGTASRLAADLVGRTMQSILEEARKEYDLIVIDGPPILGFAEPLQLAALSDSVVVVTLAGETNRKALQSVLETLGRVRARVSGVVLNRMAKDITDGYYYYGYYGKYYKYYSKYTVEAEKAGS